VRGDRLARGPMTAAVAYADAVVATRGDRPPRALPLEGEGLVVAVNRGGHLERIARARLPKARLGTVDENPRPGAVLRGSEVEARVADSVELGALSSGGGEASAKVPATVAAVLSRDRKAYWVAPAEPSLADDLDAWLLAQEADGALAQLRSESGIDP